MNKPNDTTTDGQPCYFLSVNGLEGCVAQGATLGEAIKNLKEVLDEVTNYLVEIGEVEPRDLVTIEVIQ